MKLFSKMISDRGKKGFTLVEMLIVIAVLVIIMAVAVPNVAGYVRRIELMELDDSARSIYMAVQNKMTVMKQSGENLEDLAGRSTYDSGYPAVFVKVTDPTPDPDPLNPAPAPAPDDTNYIESAPRYLRSNRGNDNALVTLTTIEGQLYNHYYVIEYDATTGRVFGVFYSEEADLLNDMAYPSSYMDLDSREFETRLHADKLVGYYGGVGDLMKVPVGGEVEKPTNVTDSTLEKLVFMLDPPEKPDGTYDTDKYYFEVKITGKDANNQEHTITIVPYDKDHPENNYYVKDGQRGTVILDSIAPGCGADDGQWYLPSDYNMSGYTLERDFKGWVYMNESSRNSFFSDTNNFNDKPSMKDSYDPYVHGIPNWNLGKSYVTGSHSNAWQYAQYFRIDPGTDIKVTIKRYKDGSLESDTFEHTVNSYFDSLDGECAVIKAGRHLQNLANQPSVSKVKSARLEKDIDFSEDTGNYDSWNSDVTYKGTPTYPYLYNFKPVNLNYGPSRGNFQFSGKGKDGVQHYIKYIRIDTVEDPRFNTDPDVKKSTAFFSSFYNTSASDVIFYCPVVIGGGDYTGVFFGQCTGGTNITNYTVINPIVESSGKYVGGLFGEIDGGGNISGHKVYVEEVENHFDNYAFDYRNRKPAENIDWSDPLNDPYQRFYVKGKNSDTYAGGLIGHINSSISNSAASIRVESEGYAGGLVGFAEGNISKCHVGGHTYNGWYVIPAGTTCGGTVLSEPAYLINIKGRKASGGFAAKSTSGIDGGYTTCSVGYYADNKSSADTFVEGSSMTSGSNDAYAIGARIGVDTHEVEEKGTDLTGTGNFWVSLTDLLEKKTNLPSCKVLKKYDRTLQEEYPYRINNSNVTDNNNQTCHLGDWPIPQTAISGYGMFYWEAEDGTYHIKAVGEFDGQTKASTLCTAMDGKGISNHGYGYFYSSDITDVNNEVLGGQDADDSIKNDIRSALNGAGLRGVTFKLLPTSDHHDNAFTFTGKKDGTTIDKTFYYNPDFCAISDSPLAKYEIRSFSQLKNLSNNNSYWDDNFELSHDIPFDGNSITPIGVSGNPFTGDVNGHCYRIVDAKLQATGSDAGLFGVIENAEINGVVVFNADYTLLNLDSGAAVGGVVGRAAGSSKITNCAFTGTINADSIGNIAAGGIVGIADGVEIELNNCQAVMSDSSIDTPDMTVKGNGGIVAAGGIAGLYYSANPLQNCYSGGYITAYAPDSALTYVGGIIGTNAQESETIRIEKCYTYYQTDIGDTAYSFPHPVGSNATYSSCFCLGGEWYNIVQTDPVGVTRHNDMESFISGTNWLINQGNFGNTNNAYSENLVMPFEYKLPAVISDNGVFYHYGKSPDETLVSLGDKRLGVFYWEIEDGKCYLKGCYYKLVTYDNGLVGYECNYFGNLCEKKDAKSITQSGYGYFIGNGVSGKDVNGFNGSQIQIDDITTALADSLKDISSEEVANSFIIRCYDYSESTDVSKQKVSIRLNNNNVTDYDFFIVPGLCYVDKDQGHDKDDKDGKIYNEIRTAQHLRNLSAVTYKDKEFKQTHDIIFTGEPMAPVGNITDPFTGEYDGGCYRIHNLRVHGAADVGLFGYTSNATIKDTFVIDGNIASTGTGNPNIGGIVGNANNTTIQNSIYTGRINESVAADNTANIGGIAGYCSGDMGSLTNCEATADIAVSGEGSANVGGIAGSVNIKDIASCYSGGSLELGESLKATVGGIVGDGNSTLTVKNCYTHMYIASENVTVHPIGNKINADNCHYIESKHHYAKDFNTNQSGIAKHIDFNIDMNGNGFGGVNNTYPTGLYADSTKAYPMPAVVKDGATFVHYGDWMDIVPLKAEAYGIFYWEKEGNDEYHVRVGYIEETSDGDFEIKNTQSDNFCDEMDGRAITQFGYGYFSCGTKELVEIDEITKGYSTSKKGSGDEAAIKAALNKCGISGFVSFEWNCGAVNKHEDSIVQLKEKSGLLTNDLKVGTDKVYVVFNRDFCYLGIWAGDKNVPVEISSKRYEIRNNEQLGNIGISTKSLVGTKYYYLDRDDNGDALVFEQTHDIIYAGNADNLLDPIGNKNNPFKNTYHGNGYRIINARYESDIKNGVNYIGLFGSTDGATITGVTMFNAMIIAPRIAVYDVLSDYVGAVGGVVGFANNTRVENCAFSGTIDVGVAGFALPRCRYAVGGIVGYGDGNNMLIKDCESVLTTSWTDSKWSASYHLSEGGIVGIANGRIENCYSGGLLEADKGGFITIGEVKVTAGGIAGSGNVTIDKCYSYIKIANNIQDKNPIGNDFAHGSLIGTTNYDVTITNCYCLKGTGFYNHDVNDANIKVVEDGNISAFAQALKGKIEGYDSLGIPRYNVKAYTTDLSNAGTYPLAAVVKDNSGQYVHYGDVSGIIRYEARAFKSGEPHGTVTVTPKYAIPGEEVTLKIEDLPHGYFVDSISITYGDNKTVALDQEFNPETRQYTFKMPEGNVKATVNIKSRLHKIVFTCDSNKGYISYEKDEAVKDDSITFTVFPYKDKGLKCKSATLVKTSDGTPVEGLNFNPADGTGSFIMPDYDVTVTAEFEEAVVIPEGKCKITVVTEGEGTVTCPAWCDKKSPTGGIFVQPATNWKIDSVKVYYNGGVIDPWNNNGEYQFNSPDVDELTLKVVFAGPHKIVVNDATVNEFKLNWTSTTYSSDLLVSKDTNVYLSLTAKTGYKITKISAVGSNGILAENDSTNISFTMPNSDVQINVEYKELPKIYVNNEHGTVKECWIGGTKYESADGLPANNGSDVTITISANAGYKITNIIVVDVANNNPVGGQQFNKDNSNITFKMPNSDVHIKVEYEALPKIFVQCEHGTVKVNNNLVTGDYTFADHDIQIGFEVIPEAGYRYNGTTVKNNRTGEILCTLNEWNRYGNFSMPNDDVTIIPEIVR